MPHNGDRSFRLRKSCVLGNTANVFGSQRSRCRAHERSKKFLSISFADPQRRGNASVVHRPYDRSADSPTPTASVMTCESQEGTHPSDHQFNGYRRPHYRQGNRGFAVLNDSPSKLPPNMDVSTNAYICTFRRNSCSSQPSQPISPLPTISALCLLTSVLATLHQSISR